MCGSLVSIEPIRRRRPLVKLTVFREARARIRSRFCCGVLAQIATCGPSPTSRGLCLVATLPGGRSAAQACGSKLAAVSGAVYVWYPTGHGRWSVASRTTTLNCRVRTATADIVVRRSTTPGRRTSLAYVGLDHCPPLTVNLSPPVDRSGARTYAAVHLSSDARPGQRNR